MSGKLHPGIFLSLPFMSGNQYTVGRTNSEEKQNVMEILCGLSVEISRHGWWSFLWMDSRSSRRMTDLSTTTHRGLFAHLDLEKIPSQTRPHSTGQLLSFCQHSPRLSSAIAGSSCGLCVCFPGQLCREGRVTSDLLEGGGWLVGFGPAVYLYSFLWLKLPNERIHGH